MVKIKGAWSIKVSSVENLNLACDRAEEKVGFFIFTFLGGNKHQFENNTFSGIVQEVKGQGQTCI